MKRAKPRECPQKGFETCLKHLPAHHLRLYAPSVTASLLYFAFYLRERCVDFVCFGFIAGAFSSASFPWKGQSPVSAPKKGLKPLWNTFRLTISDCMLLRLQHHCFILLFTCGKDVLILYVLVSSPGHFEGQWSSSSSASCPETEQSPVSAPKGSEPGPKLPLTAHHLRLYASSGTASLLWNCWRNV